MPADYSKMKVPELRDALTARGLPTNGLKGDLISRLTASDESSPSTATSTDKPSTAAPTATSTTTAPAAHLPSADEEYEVDWEHDDKPAAAAPATATSAPAVAPTTPSATAPAEPTTTTTTASAAASPSTDTKPKRKTIASLFESTTPATKSGNEPSSPSTVTDETSSAAAPAPTPAAAAAAPTATTTPTPAFSANLPTTSLDEEIARRKKRAERFGLSAEESETLKSLERQKRFGIEEVKTEVKGLNEALPVEREKKRRGDAQPAQQQGRGGKRGRFETAGQQQQNQQQQNQQQQGGRRRGNRGVGAGAGVVESGRVKKPVQPSGGMSAEDRKRADERRKRFAA